MPTTLACTTEQLRAFVASDDLTIPGFGAPQVAIVISTQGDTVDAFADSAVYSITFYDGTNLRCLAASARDNLATEDGQSSASSSLIFQLQPDGSVNWNGTLSFIADGVRITYGNQADRNNKVILILIKGLLNYAVGDQAPSTSAGGTQNVNIGFEPDAIIGLTQRHAGDFAAGVNGDVDWWYSLGFAINKPVIKNHCVSSWELWGIATSNPYNEISDLYIGAKVGGESYDLDISAFGATGFTLRTVNNGTAAQADFAYLALQFDGEDYDVQILDISTGTGAKTFTPFAFRPKALFIGATPCTAVNTEYTSGNETGAHGIGVVSEEDITVDISTAIGIEDNVGTMNTTSIISADIVKIPSGNAPATVYQAADFTAFNNSGFSLNFGTNGAGSVTKYLAFAFGDVTRVPDLMPMLWSNM